MTSPRKQGKAWKRLPRNHPRRRQMTIRGEWATYNALRALRAEQQEAWERQRNAILMRGTNATEGVW